MIICVTPPAIIGQVEVNGFVIHLWTADDDPDVEYLFEGLAGVDMSIYNNTNDDDCETTTSSSPCAGFESEVDYSGPGTNFISLSAARQATTSAEFVEDGMVTVLDVAKVNQYINEVSNFHSILQFIAADITGDGVVDHHDKDTLHKILLYTSLPLDIVDSWNIFATSWFAVGDFIDYFLIYEPSDEDYNDLWETYTGAFNHYDDETYITSSYQFTATSGLYTHSMNAIKIGDLNFSTAAVTACAGGELPEELDEFSKPNSIEIVDRFARQTHASLVLYSDDSESDIVDITLDELQEIGGIQLYLEFIDDVKSIEFLKSDLKDFSTDNIYFDRELGILNIVWVDNFTSKELPSDRNVLIRFKCNGLGDNLESAVKQNFERYSCVVDRELKETAIVLHNYAGMMNTSVAYPNPCDDIVHFVIPFIDLVSAEITIEFYDLQGRKLAVKKAGTKGRLASVRIDDLGLDNGIVYYKIKTRYYSNSGKLVVQRN